MRGSFILVLVVLCLCGCLFQSGGSAQKGEVPSDEELDLVNQQLRAAQLAKQRQAEDLTMENSGVVQDGAGERNREVNWIDAPGIGANRPTVAVAEENPGVEAAAELGAGDDTATVSADQGDSRSTERRSERTGMALALEDSARMLLDRSGEIVDESSLEGLSWEQRRQIVRLRQMLLEAERQAVQDGLLDLDLLAHDLRGDQDLPMMIKRMELCLSVTGYGVYSPLPTRKLLAGREHPMIVYLELENVQPETGEDGHYTARLTEEIRLYERRDGLMVWRQEPIEIVDRSRNRRRDFFVVQVVRLPANLTVGEYRLKARVKDSVGQTVAEEMVDLTVVADPDLLFDEEREEDRQRAAELLQNPELLGGSGGLY